MSVLKTRRQQIVTALEGAGLTAYVTVPAKWTPPGVFVGPGDPYITHQGAGFGALIANFQVSLVTARGTNDKRADELDELVLEVLAACYGLDELGFGVGDVAQPGRISVNGQDHLGVGITLAIELHSLTE